MEQQKGVPLLPLFEKMFNLSKINSKEGIVSLITQLRAKGDEEIPISKYAELYEKKDE